MSKSIKHLGVLYNNPFVLGHVLYSFFAGLPHIDRGVLLSYIVFPLCLYPTSQAYLKNSNKSSRLLLLASKHERLFGLQDRIQDYKSLTNLTLQYGVDLGVIKISKDMGIELLRDWPGPVVAPPNASKAAEKLGRLVEAYDVPTTYRMLGVKTL